MSVCVRSSSMQIATPEVAATYRHECTSLGGHQLRPVYRLPPEQYERTPCIAGDSKACLQRTPLTGMRRISAPGRGCACEHRVRSHLEIDPCPRVSRFRLGRKGGEKDGHSAGINDSLVVVVVVEGQRL